MANIRHYHHTYHFSYNTTLRRHIGSVIFVLLMLLAVVMWAFHYIFPTTNASLHQFSPITLLVATWFTLLRLTVAYICAVVLAVPVSLFITSTPRIEKVLLPIVDIVQSVPVLAFFPLIVLIFIRLNLYDGAAIFVLFMAMLWNLVFSMIGGLKTIPNDVKDAATVFNISGLRKLRVITLPAIFPYLVTGSLLAWGQGWSIVIVAEVLHNYLPNGNPDQDLIGLGSILVNSSAAGNQVEFISSLLVMVVIIGFINIFIWQKLLHITERFKFD